MLTIQNWQDTVLQSLPIDKTITFPNRPTMDIEVVEMYIIGAKMYIIGVKMYILGVKMYIFGVIMYIFGVIMYIHAVIMYKTK